MDVGEEITENITVDRQEKEYIMSSDTVYSSPSTVIKNLAPEA
jgi:hypothetical protein